VQEKTVAMRSEYTNRYFDFVDSPITSKQIVCKFLGHTVGSGARLMEMVLCGIRAG
jgi:hypothetical protein